MPHTLLTRKQPALTWSRIAAAGAGGAATIAVLGLLTDSLGFPVLVAAFGSSCVLVFTMPDAPVSQPINVVGGHVLSATCGLVARQFLPVEWWSLALTVGVALAAMAALRITHPPAGGTPIAVLLGQEGWLYLLMPILIGSVIVAVCGLVYRALLAAASRRAEPAEAQTRR